MAIAFVPRAMALHAKGKGVAMVFSSIPSHPPFSLCCGVCRLDGLMLQIPSPPQTANGEVRKEERRKKKARREGKKSSGEERHARRRSLCSEASCLTENRQFFQGHRRSQGRDLQSWETVNKETPGGRTTTQRGKAVKCCHETTRKVANHGEREAEPKKRFDVKQTELTGSITC